MASIAGDRQGRNVGHNTVTPAAKKVYQRLLAAGFAPHPGHIIGTGGKGGVRLKLTYAPSRTDINIIKTGCQSLFLYGPVDRALLEATLRGCQPQSMTIRG